MREIILNLDSRDKALYHDTIIREGENKASKLKIILTEEFIGYNYALLFQLNDNVPIVSDSLGAINGILDYEITNAVTNESGQLRIELNAYNDLGVLVKTATTVLPIMESLDGITSESMPTDYVPWYIQAVEQANISKEQSIIATEQAEIASELVDMVTDKVAQAILVDGTLEDNIDIGTTLNIALEGSISTATDTKSLLDTSVVDGVKSKVDLDGSISLSGTTQAELETVIDEGVLVKGQIEEKIIEFGTIVNTYGSLVGK